MSKTLTSLLLVVFLAVPAWPQEEQSSGDVEDPDATETAVADETGGTGGAGEQGIAAEAAPTEIDEADEVVEPAEIVDPDFDDTGLDEQNYEEDDDDFVPSEEIPADEPIPFPSNI